MGKMKDWKSDYMNQKEGYQDISCEIQKVAKSKSSTQLKIVS
jgi:hypothetical protein